MKIGSAPNAERPKLSGEEDPTRERNPGNIGRRNRSDTSRSLSSDSDI